RSNRSHKMEHARARPLVLGFRLPLFELPPRTSLFRRRALLQAARAAARPRTFLCAARHAMAELFGPGVRMARREPRTSYQLARGGADRAEFPGAAARRG